MKILVTGGSGMVGRELRVFLPNATYLSSEECDLRSDVQVKDYFLKNRFDYVIHLAAHVGSLHDNIKNRVSYYDNNVLMNTLVTKYAFESGVRKLLGILSTCIYPNVIAKFPMKEEVLHEGAPHSALMSYAYAKRSHAVQLDAYREQYGVDYYYLIPSNLYGLVSESHRGRSHYVNDLVDKIIEAKSAGDDHITLFGDGTPLRQFMYSIDFAQVIYRYITEDIMGSMNVAPPENFTVDQIARIALKSCDATHLRINYDASLPNGQDRKDVDTTRLMQSLPNFRFTPLEKGIRDLYVRLNEGRK